MKYPLYLFALMFGLCCIIGESLRFCSTDMYLEMLAYLIGAGIQTNSSSVSIVFQNDDLLILASEESAILSVHGACHLLMNGSDVKHNCEVFGNRNPRDILKLFAVNDHSGNSLHNYAIGAIYHIGLTGQYYLVLLDTLREFCSISRNSRNCVRTAAGILPVTNPCVWQNVHCVVHKEILLNVRLQLMDITIIYEPQLFPDNPLKRKSSYPPKVTEPMEVNSTATAMASRRLAGLSAGSQQALCAIIAASNINSTFPTWNCYSNGTVGSPPCNAGSALWTGVICSGGEVVGLQIWYQHSLSGELESVRCFLSLFSVMFTGKMCSTGSVSSSLELATSLTIMDLRYSPLFVGSILSSIALLTNLKCLSLTGHRLTGRKLLQYIVNIF